MTTDKIDIVLKNISDSRNETREDLKEIFKMIGKFPCQVNSEKISRLEKKAEKKTAFWLGFPALLLTIFNLILLIKNLG